MNEQKILEVFNSECKLLDVAIKAHFKTHYLPEDDNGYMLFAAGTKFYDSVDPIILRGIVVTTRLLLVKTETTSFEKISSLLIKGAGLKSKASILTLRRRFRQLRKDTNDIFDMFWHNEHIHKDLSGERYEKYFDIMHSCAGPLTYTAFFDAIIEFNDLIQQLNSEFVTPKLRA